MTDVTNPRHLDRFHKRSFQEYQECQRLEFIALELMEQALESMKKAMDAFTEYERSVQKMIMYHELRVYEIGKNKEKLEYMEWKMKQKGRDAKKRKTEE